MLHDPTMECTCDGKGCRESIYLEMRWQTGGYDTSDEDAERQLVCEDWSVEDGVHLCPDCAERIWT